jgi:hypothetical protein
MMGGILPETCWASYKYEIKFRYTVESCWIFLVNYFPVLLNFCDSVCDMTWGVTTGQCIMLGFIVFNG